MYKSYFEELTQSLKVWDYKIEHLALACLLGSKKAKKDFKRFLKQCNSTYSYEEALKICYNIFCKK